METSALEAAASEEVEVDLVEDSPVAAAAALVVVALVEVGSHQK